MKSPLGHGGVAVWHSWFFPPRFLLPAIRPEGGRVSRIVCQAFASRLSHKVGYSIKEDASVTVTPIRRFGRVFRKAAGPFVLSTLSLAPVSVAEVYKCFDEATGELAFTDQACPNDQSGNHHPIGTKNFVGGFNSSAPALAQKKREAEQSELLRNWQAHNAKLQKVLDRERAREEEERAQAQRIRNGERGKREQGSSETES